ncbi:MAG TPA: EF-P lysine aminoacylase EpmA [Polyangiales bacterium]
MKDEAQAPPPELGPPSPEGLRILASELDARAPADRVVVAGRVVASDAGKALLRDESGTLRLVGAELPPALSLARLRGRWNGVALEVERCLELHSPRDFGELRESELWALTRDSQRRHQRLLLRARLLREIRAFFDARGFLEVETPLVVPSPGLDLHLDALSVNTSQGTRYLVTSPEYQMKRLLAGGLERIYQLGKCFRNDEIGARHQPEFTMLEWYRGFADVEAVMRDTEELVATLARALTGAPLLRSAWGDVDVTPPWPRVSMRQAFARFCGESMDEALRDEEHFFRQLVERVEPGLAGMGAVFLCEWPASMASLARKKPGDPSVAERFEAYVGGLELCNGFGELTDVDEQRARLRADQAARQAAGLPVYPIDERFVAALAQGIPPSGGNALGVDRLLMLLLGAEAIEDVVAIGSSRL